MPPADGELEPGTTLGRFVIVRLLGRGGMGAVYEARDPDLDRSVGLKLLASARGQREGSLRLIREAQALAQLQHPNVVSVHEVGVADGLPFIAMEYVDGETLEAHLRGAALAWQGIVALFLQAGRGLAAAHGRSIVHRDFKPANVLVDRQGRVRVTDFGLARLARSAPPGDAALSSAAALDAETDGGTLDESPAESPLKRPSALLGTSLTGIGSIVGTPRYMAPEQRAGRAATARSDQYSFCVALWEALAGELPPVPGGIRALPRPLVAALEKGLSPAPAERHESMAALLAELERVLAPSARRRRLVAIAGAALLAASGVAGAGLLRPANAVHCELAGVEARSAWNGATRSRVAEAFARVRPDAPGAAAAPLTLLDAYADGWQAARVAACRATHERGEQSVAMLDRSAVCLDRAVVALRLVVDSLERIDAAGVDRALDAVSRLPRLAACSAADVAAGPAPSHDPRAQAGERSIAAANVAFQLGRADESLLQAETGLAAARTLGDPSLLARALLPHARALAERNNPHGRAELEEAVIAAARAGDRSVEADVMNSLLKLTIDDGATERVDALLPAVRASIAGAGNQGSAHTLAANEARILIKAHRPAAELAAACDRVAAVERPGDTPLALECRCTAAFSLRDVEAGKLHCAALIEAKRTRYGPTHPEVAFALVNLAGILEDAGELERALELLEEARPIYERAFGEGPKIVALLINLGNVLGEVDRLADARRILERALAIVRAGERPTRRMANVLVSLAGTVALLGDAEATVRYGDEGMHIAEKLLGKDSGEMVAYHVSYGEALRDAGLLPQALATFVRGEALARATMPGDVLQGLAALGQATILNRLGRPREALPHAEAALAVAAAVKGDPYNVAQAHDELGRALLGVGGRGAEARRELETAREGYRALDHRGAKALAQVEGLLAP